jgi:hypothetical protein
VRLKNAKAGAGALIAPLSHLENVEISALPHLARTRASSGDSARRRDLSETSSG